MPLPFWPFAKKARKPAPPVGQSSHFAASSEHPVIRAALDVSGAKWNAPDRFLSFLWSLRKFDSAAEFGCARAEWLRATRRHGAAVIRGYDIPEIDLRDRQLTEEEFVASDLSQEIPLDRRFDLAISTEVGEHLPIEAAPVFVDTLTRAADWVLFGAALPFQGGMNHINENWVEFWAQLFAERGYLCYDVLRPRFWHDPAVPFYYRQNTCLYVKTGADWPLIAAGHRATDRPMSMVHPEQYLKAVGSAPRGLDSIVAAIRSFYRPPEPASEPAAAEAPESDAA